MLAYSTDDTGFRDVTKTKPAHFRQSNKAPVAEKQQGPTTFEGAKLDASMYVDNPMPM